MILYEWLQGGAIQLFGKNKMLGKNKMYFQTVNGRRRLLDDLEKARRTEARKRLERGDYLNGGSNSSSEDARADAAAFDNELATATGNRVRLENVFAQSARIAPEPKNVETVQINHYVTVKVDKNFTIVLIGGYGEETETIVPPIVDYTQKPWAFLMRREVGDIVECAGKEYEIIQIQLRADYEAQQRQNVA